MGLPILLLTIFAVFLFGIILTVQQVLAMAVIEASREAAKVPATVAGANSVELAAADAANEILAVYGLSVTGSSPKAQIVVEDSTGSAWGGATIVSSPCGAITPPSFQECASTSVAPADTARVRVRLLVTFSSIPIPNMLTSMGLHLGTDRFDVTSDALR